MMCFVKKYHLLTPLFLLLFVFSVQAQNNKATDSTLVKILQLKDTAATYAINQDYGQALITLNKAYRKAIIVEHDSLKHDLQIKIAKLHYHLHNFDKANSLADNSLEYLPKNVNSLQLASAYTLKGFVAIQKKNFDSAEDYFTKADKIYLKANNETNRATVLMGLGILELQKQEYGKAINYFDAILPVFESNKLDYLRAMTLLNKADALLALKTQNNHNTETAENSYNQAIESIKDKPYIELKAQAFLIASKIEQAKGNLDTSISYINQYNQSLQANYSSYFKAITDGMDEETNLSYLKDTIEQQNKQMKKDDQSLNFIKYTTGLSIALIIILSLLTLSLYKNNNLRAKANNLLLDKNTELQLSKEKAEQASLAKAQFLSTITHELRTPLYAVTGLTHLLQEEDPKPHQKEHLSSLKFSGEYLLSLINNILDLNKLEANKVELERRTFDLKKRISDVLVALNKSAEDRNNKVTLDFDSTLPEKLIGDSVKLSQVLINLIGNSLKFTQNGFVTVRVSKIEDKGNRVMLHFEIEDDGVGISQKKQKTIFESFSQASLQVNRKFGGTGLGLAIVKNLLELMNSKIQLESELGKGSKFWFNIAFDKIEDKNMSIEQTLDKPKINYSLLEGKNILVVEDNKINQMITRKILEKNNIICHIVDNGLDGVKLSKEREFDIILMDIHMPGISGIEATKKIREFNTETPIIALTAVTIDENLDEFYKAGFNDIIPKPFKTEEFFNKIHTILKKKEKVS